MGELVVFDADQIFVEYVLEYEPKFFDDVSGAFARCDPSSSGRVRFAVQRLDREVRCLFDIAKLLKKDLLDGKRWPLPERTAKPLYASIADIEKAWRTIDVSNTGSVTLTQFQQWVQA